VLHPLRSYWVPAPLVLPPSPPLSPSPISFRSLRCADATVGVGVAGAPCMRLYSQPSLPSTPVKVLRQVSVPVFSTNSFPRTPREFGDFHPPQRSSVPCSGTAESPRNTIQPSMVPPTPPTPREPREPRGEPRGGGEPESRVPVKIRVVTAPLKKKEATPPLERVSPAPVEKEREREPPTLLRSRGAAVKKQLELSRQKADEIRAIERKWREVAAEQRRLEAERLRLEAERQRAMMQQKTGEERQRRQNEQRRESLAEDLRRLAEEKRRVRREEQEEVERKRVEAQRSRQEAASRRLHRKLLLVEEKHRLAEEARRAIEEGRRRRFSGSGGGPADAGRGSKAETHRGHRLSEVHRRHSSEGSKRRAKSADADQECEAERRKAEQERQRKEEEEAERRRKRHEHLQGLAEESKRRIEATGWAWHQVLNVAREATLQEVKQAFRDLALLHHPDKGLESCNETFRIVRGAYQRALAFFQEKDQAGT